MRPYQNYQRVNVSTADPVRVVVLLYEGAIKNLNQSIRVMGTDIETASAKLTRTLEIINYLRSVLDHEKGGEIATNLERLYEYMRDTLSEANIRHDTEKIQSVIGLLQTLLEGWRGIVASQGGEGETEHPVAPTDPPAQPLGLSMVG